MALQLQLPKMLYTALSPCLRRKDRLLPTAWVSPLPPFGSLAIMANFPAIDGLAVDWRPQIEMAAKPRVSEGGGRRNYRI